MIGLDLAALWEEKWRGELCLEWALGHLSW